MEHMKDIARVNIEGNAIVKHLVQEHNGMDPTFRCRTITTEEQTLRRFKTNLIETKPSYNFKCN